MSVYLLKLQLDVFCQKSNPRLIVCNYLRRHFLTVGVFRIDVHHNEGMSTPKHQFCAMIVIHKTADFLRGLSVKAVFWRSVNPENENLYVSQWQWFLHFQFSLFRARCLLTPTMLEFISTGSVSRCMKCFDKNFALSGLIHWVTFPIDIRYQSYSAGWSSRNSFFFGYPEGF